MSFEENEISKNAFGGTEIAKRKLAELIDPKLLENFQIISSRHRNFEEDKIRLFWCHDLPEDPESQKFRDKNFINGIHKFIFISDWQYQRYQLVHGIPYNNKSIILESGIEPAPQEALIKNNDVIRIAYTSTPQRGLELLVPVFKKLAEKYPNIHLDVFSSFKIYGWDQADEQYEPLYDQIRNHPQMTYHGFVPNDQLKSHLNTCHIWGYPNIWLETSCRAMLEAMSAGLICVHPNFGALPETSGALNIMYQGDFDDKNNHANIFARNLEAAIMLVESGKNKDIIAYNKFYVDSRFTIARIKNQWEIFLQSMLKEYPTVESRKIPPEMFRYKTP